MSSSRNLLFMTAMIVAVFGNATLKAQSASTMAPTSAVVDSAPAGASAAMTAGSRMSDTATGTHRELQATGALSPQEPFKRLGKAKALMVVGGAAFVLGALIGQEVGTLFMVGGAASFLIGLFQHVR